MSKPSRKAPPPAPPPPAAKPSKTPLAIGVAIVAVLAVAVFAFVRTDRDPQKPPPANATVTAQAQPTVTPAAAVQPPAPPTPAEIRKPHPQKNLPPLDLPAYPLGRSPEAIHAAYRFAAEHPEVLTFVPCFCGCERSGHRGNEDCFVKARDANGDVTQWEPHGMECNVCLDVATQAMQMYSSGASVRDIRSAVEKKWASQSAQMHTHTPTPEPPK